MTEKTDVQVVINGKVLTMSGYESEEYLQRVALYINNKIAECNRSDAYRHASKDDQHMLLEINMVDDYFKAKQDAEKFEAELKIKQNELYDMKHDVINKDMMIKQTKESLHKCELQLQEAQKKIAVLEAENKDKRR
jgi:cell division protein ZapA